MTTLDLTQPTCDPLMVLDAEADPDSGWAACVREGDRAGAVAAFVDLLRTGDARTCAEHDVAAVYRKWFDKQIGYQGGFHLDPDRVVEQRYIGCYGVEHVFKDEIDWFADPMGDLGENSSREWSAQFNRHYQWVPLADAYAKTGDAKYARAWANELQTWMAQAPRPRVIDNRVVPNPWRTIEMGIRAGWTWPYAFETFRRCDDVDDDTLWLLICGFHQHGIGLLESPTARNFKAMEVNGLAHVGFMFPEFQFAFAFASTAVDRAIGELERQFYDDGAQIELAPAYAGVSITNLQAAFHLARMHGTRPGCEIPPRVWQRLGHAVDALGRIARPEGIAPAMHDSDEHDIEAAWRTYHGDADAPWLSGQSDHLPWAGYAVMRRADRWALFDAGPHGAAHQHHDSLQLLTWANGHPFTTDPGKPTYDRSAMSRHIRSAAGHNVVLCDGKPHAQEPLVLRAETPLPMVARDHVAAARRTFITIGDDPTRFNVSRLVVDIDALGWLVIDQVDPEDDREHHWQWLWHFDVDALDVSTHAIASHADGAAMHVAFSGSVKVDLADVTGQIDPVLRGWRGVEGAQPIVIPTLQVTSAPRAGRATLCTLLSIAGERMIDRASQGDEGFTVDIGDVRVVVSGLIEQGGVTVTS